MSDKIVPSISVEPTHAAIYLLRTAQQNHVQLSVMADQKANIVIGVSLVMFTLVLSKAQAGDLSAPLMMLGVTALVAALFAIMAVNPTLKRGRQHNTGERANVLFFGDFARVGEAEFMQSMQETLSGENEAYTAMARDLYHMGVALYRRKYRYLTYSYRTFLFGLFATATVSAYSYLP